MWALRSEICSSNSVSVVEEGCVFVGVAVFVCETAEVGSSRGALAEDGEDSSLSGISVWVVVGVGVVVDRGLGLVAGERVASGGLLVFNGERKGLCTGPSSRRRLGWGVLIIHCWRWMGAVV